MVKFTLWQRPQPDYQLWRRTRDDSERSHISPVNDVNTVGTRTGTALIVFPGAEVLHGRERYFAGRPIGSDLYSAIGGFAKEAEKLVGPELLPHTDIVVASYFSDKYTTALRRKINNSTDYVEPAMVDFARKYVKPLIDEGTTVTLLGYSVGTACIESLRRSLIALYREEGVQMQQINSNLSSVVAANYGVVAINNSTDEPEFTSAVVVSVNDKVTEEFYPGHFHLTRRGRERPGKLSLDNLSDISALITTDTAIAVRLRDDNAELTGEQMIVPDAHHTYFYTTPNNVAPSGAVLSLQRFVRNAVVRRGPVDDVMSLLLDGSHDPVRKGVELEAQAISEAYRLQDRTQQALTEYQDPTARRSSCPQVSIDSLQATQFHTPDRSRTEPGGQHL